MYSCLSLFNREWWTVDGISSPAYSASVTVSICIYNSKLWYVLYWLIMKADLIKNNLQNLHDYTCYELSLNMLNYIILDYSMPLWLKWRIDRYFITKTMMLSITNVYAKNIDNLTLKLINQYPIPYKNNIGRYNIWWCVEIMDLARY